MKAQPIRRQFFRGFGRDIESVCDRWTLILLVGYVSESGYGGGGLEVLR